MAKIMVDIHCNTESCRECRFEKENYSRGKGFCLIFLKILEYDHSGSCFRLPECIAAEIPREYSTAAFKALTRFYEETKGLKPLTTDEIDELYGVAREISTEVKE